MTGALMFRVLHISDVHIQSSNAATVYDRVKALTAATAGLMPIDFIAFTGDASQSAEEDHLNLFWKKVAEPLLTEFKLEPTRFLIVPGNHDVDRRRVDEVLEIGFHNKIGNPDSLDGFWRTERYRKATMERLERFSAWADAHRLQRASTVVSVDGINVGFACINSAWLSSGNGERHDLAITRAQVLECEEALVDAEFKIALFHHPLDWLHDTDKARVREQLFSAFDVYMKGHLHDADGSQTVSPRGHTISLQAPALFSPKCFPGFNVYEFDLKTREATVYSYRLHDKRLEYYLNQDVLPDAKPWVIPLMPKRADPKALQVIQHLNTSLAIKYSASLERLVPIIAHPSKLPVTERLLQPNLSLVGKKGHLKLNRIINDSGSFIVLGEPHSGKTTFLEQLGEKFVSQGVMAALVTPDRLSTEDGKAGVAITLAKLFATSNTQARKWAEGPLVLLIDEAGCGIPEERWGTISKWIDECPRLRVIVACSQKAVGNVGAAARSFKIAKLEPLPVATIKKELARLGDRLALPSGISVEKAIDTLLDAELPRWPWAILMLVDVTARGDGRDVTNLASLLRRYVEHRLGATATPGEDAKIRARMLRVMASEMMTRKSCELERVTAEELIRKEVARVGIDAKAEALLEDLLQTRLLVADDDRVRFAFVVLQEYFFAESMNETQWSGVAGLDADSFLRFAGSLAFLSEMAQVPGLVEKGFELTRSSLPRGASPLSIEKLSSLATALPHFDGDEPGEAAVARAEVIAPGDEDLDKSVKEAESANRNSRLARVSQGKERLQSLGVAVEELFAAVTVLRSSAWINKETKAQLVTDALEMAATLVNELSQESDLLTLIKTEAPEAADEAASIVVAVMLLIIGSIVSGQGGARHLSLTLNEVYSKEKDPIRRLIALMWYVEAGAAEGSPPKADLLEKVESFIAASRTYTELALLEMWLVVKYTTSYAWNGAGEELKKCLRRVVSERAKSAPTRAAAAIAVDQRLAEIQKEKALVERAASEREAFPDPRSAEKKA